LIGILENICVTPERGKGLSRITFIWWRGYFMKRNNRKAYFGKGLERGALK